MRDLNLPSRNGTTTSRDATKRDTRRNRNASSRDPMTYGGFRIQPA
jgi:hypothetical protein